ncbi:MAG: 5-formyltetrahydrofolate cyclo-ligase [Bacteroidetes bacterium GWF2_33_16]|nr:MAG: 5-formyltetrahydrofolate cyclo-ligase [Bacteroidetes bacterium GWE2_32_14]OFY03881.1 MAG: 5-formyltetrahydrofolate cyclo-ligase [Bacteroidetes bacterium GWF2_33_16]
MIDSKKKEIRNQIKELKKSFSFENKKERSIRIFEKIEILPEFIQANTIMAYWSMDDEVNTHDFILKWFETKRFILPSVNGAELELREFKGIQFMSKGSAFGISEPNEIFNDTIDIIDFIVVPGVAFDKNNNRLGRGKAYYDKLLKNTKAFKAGVCLDFQIVESVPTNEFDIKMDIVITD